MKVNELFPFSQYFNKLNLIWRMIFFFWTFLGICWKNKQYRVNLAD